MPDEETKLLKVLEANFTATQSKIIQAWVEFRIKQLESYIIDIEMKDQKKALMLDIKYHRHKHPIGTVYKPYTVTRKDVLDS